MKKVLFRIITIFLLFNCNSNLFAQINLHTEDLPRFYQAFDSVLTTSDTSKQIEYINKIYIEPSSKGLKKFMELRGGNASEWRKFIELDKQNLILKRPLILSVLNQEKLIKRKINKFKRLYPNFRDGDIFFCVGINNSGGTIYDNTVYIGTEVAATDKKDWSVFLVLHEFVHTQQWTQRNVIKILASESLLQEYENTHTQLLGKCIEEGMADFISELVYGKSLAKVYPSGHIAFGLENEKSIKDIFYNEMFLPFTETNGWLYSEKEINGKKVSDLGYFIGYQICKSYYIKSKNKQLALKTMIELDLTDNNSKEFLINSGYFNKDEIEKLIMK